MSNRLPQRQENHGMKWRAYAGANMMAVMFFSLCLFAISAAEALAAEDAKEGQAGEQQAAKQHSAPDYSENRFSVAVYGGFLTTQAFSELYSGPNKLVNTNIIAASVSRELFSVGHAFGVKALEPLKLEVEGIYALHTGEWPHSQNFSEYAGSFNLRWHRFPWNRYVVTTMGFGEGLSYATEKPSYEIEINNKTAYLMNFLMFDVTFAHPDLPELALMLRLHHRSGVFGLFDDVSGGSNFFVAGLKYTF